MIKAIKKTANVFDVAYLLRMHSIILTKTEKRRFVLLSLLFLLTSALDIVGIGAMGTFLIMMMNPALFHKVPLLGNILPANLPTQLSLVLLGSIILSAFLIKTVSNCLVQKKIIAYCFAVGSRIRIQLMDQYLYAPYSFLISNHTSDMINKVLNQASSYSSLSLTAFMTMTVHIIFLFFILLFLLVVHPGVTLLLILMMSVMLGVYLFLMRGKLYQLGKNIDDTSKQIIKNVQEGLAGLKEVRVLSKETYFLDKIKKASDLHAQSHGHLSIFQKIPFYLLENMMFIFIITLCLLELSLGTDVKSIIALCGILVTAGVRLLPSLYQIVLSIVNMQGHQHTLETIYHHLYNFKGEYNNETPWPKKTLESTHEHTTFTSIKLENISYHYPSVETEALQEINLEIKKGQSIGIIGASGAGKSTLVDILLGLLAPTQGKITMDGVEISDRKCWVDKFAYIPQAIYLLDDTIEKNIVFGNAESVTDIQRFKQALKLAQLEELISSLPDGKNTVIGENGVKLSGGQRQRIALARAFYHEREIIVMDEATAALDNKTEQRVVESIKQLQQIKTMVIIAHRYTTVEHCDVIYRLEQGRLVASGSYAEVIG